MYVNFFLSIRFKSHFWAKKFLPKKVGSATLVSAPFTIPLSSIPSPCKNTSVVDPNPKRIRKFWLDPNPKKCSDSDPKKMFGYGSRHCCRMKNLVKNRRSNTWKRKKLFFYWKNFFSDVRYRFQNTYKSNKNLRFKIWVLRIRIRKKIWDSESEKNEFASPTLKNTKTVLHRANPFAQTIQTNKVSIQVRPILPCRFF
jgi:hypothetical protein